LIAAIGFVSFVQFVVKTKKIIVVGNKQPVAFVLTALLFDKKNGGQKRS
jgi:hypothetical protein